MSEVKSMNNNMKEIIQSMKNANSDITIIGEILASVDDSNFTDEEWNSLILTACEYANATSDAVLASVENAIGYKHFLEEEAEEYYQMINNAEHPIYGCDPYPEY